MVFILGLKKSSRWWLLIIPLAILSLVFLGYFKTAKPKPVLNNQTEGREFIGLPVKLIIPAIGINANIQYLGVNQAGEMEIPNNIIDVGWFKLGSKPGEKGSAVIAGHLNGVGDESGVFANLDKLKTGDKLEVQDDGGKVLTFVVWKTGVYDFGYADEVFSRNDGVYLNLITCDGEWDKSKNSYKQRLVVFTKIVN